MKGKTIVCLACSFKGYDFMDEAKSLGCRVMLITSEHLKDKNWPWHAIDEVFYLPEIAPSTWNMEHFTAGFAHLLSLGDVHAIVALDDYDVEKAAQIRETFRIPGMGQTTHRNFRDKLAMRMKAQESGIAVPEFTSVFNDQTISEFIEKNPAPWVLKPRSEASATGIRKIKSEEELWESIHNLGEQRYRYLLESFKPGDVFHVDSLVFGSKVVFTSVSQYLATPMEVSHQGGVFRTRTLSKKSKEYKALEKLNAKLLKSFGLRHGATHTEFIQNYETGEWYFLETASRVGGAHISDMLEAATGINIWREWAKIEMAVLHGETYKAPKPEQKSAGLIIALANAEHPDMAPFRSLELWKELQIDHHVGMVFRADKEEEVLAKMEEATQYITENLLNFLPPKHEN